MHYTLTLRGNVILIVLWIAAVAVIVITRPLLSVQITVVFAVLGVIAGMLQSKALQVNAMEFLVAKTAKQVRAAIVSSLYGKLSIAVLWITGLALASLLIYGGNFSTWQNVVVCYAVFSITRELKSLSSVVALSKLN
jgi:hypothetical protein